MPRVAITGLGAVTPLGNDAKTTWEGLVSGRSGIDFIRGFDASGFPVRIAGEVKDFDATAVVSARAARHLDKPVLFALAAAKEAMGDAGVNGYDPERVAVVVGCCVGGIGQAVEQWETLKERGWSRMSPFFLANFLVDSPGGHLAIELGLKGPNHAVVSACATGSSAVGEGADLIRMGHADMVLAGGTEGAITPLILGGFCAMRGLANDEEEPARAVKPFDARRGGFVMAEGAAVLVLEDLDAATARGATVYAEVLGHGGSNDAYHMAQPDPEATGVVTMIRQALEQARVPPEDVDYVNAHGTGTPLGDAAETKAIKEVFGDHAYELAVSSTKSMTGHMFGAAGAVEALASALAIHHGVIPPTINYDEPDPECDLDYVPNEAREADVRLALSNAMGLGGHNACVLLGHPG
ncbi:MAG: beta-ketoacyl-ACP synthase II [Actinomycetota bacterium]|jgi:beta-ketoacyl-acyl-carrier-protein synthase II|nr:beta-ketoacyl-ACP synthase II [Actinomycetota bacterium]